MLITRGGGDDSNTQRAIVFKEYLVLSNLTFKCCRLSKVEVEVVSG